MCAARGVKSPVSGPRMARALAAPPPKAAACGRALSRRVATRAPTAARRSGAIPLVRIGYLLSGGCCNDRNKRARIGLRWTGRRLASRGRGAAASVAASPGASGASTRCARMARRRPRDTPTRRYLLMVRSVAAAVMSVSTYAGLPTRLTGAGPPSRHGRQGDAKRDDKICDLQSAIFNARPWRPLGARGGLAARPRSSRPPTRTIRQSGERDATMGDSDYGLLVAGRNPRFCSALYGDGGARPGGRERAERAR